ALQARTLGAVAEDDEARFAPQARRDAEEEVVVLDRGEAADDADGELSRGRALRERRQLHPQRHDVELLRAPDPERLVDLAALLLAQDDDAVGVRARQEALDGDEDPRLPPRVVAV